ncbi:MAG TPA: hypothetical protein VN289_14485, partial [Paraburkholderia sp.]|nr:hypothetical protein [Paraburkholderia sp.]
MSATAFFFFGIRDLLSVCQRCPYAGRHLLFFAAAKKSRQKKAGSHRQPLTITHGRSTSPRFIPQRSGSSS